MRMQTGVTLIELMIVVVVVSILVAIGYPSYRQYMIRTNRSVAKTQLLQTAQNLERCFTRTNTYVGCVVGFTTQDNNYQVTIATPSATTYTLTATPQGGQAGDNKCGTFTLNQAGTQTASGSLGAVPCWAK